MKQLGVALHNYNDRARVLPYSGCVYAANGHTWNEFILPYVEQGTLYSQIDFRFGNYQAPNTTLLINKRMAFQECPSNPYCPQMKTITGSVMGSQTDATGGLSLGPCSFACYAPCAGPTGTQGTPADCACSSCFCNVAGSSGTGTTAATSPGMFNAGGAWSCDFAAVLDGLSNTLMLCERRNELDYHGCIWCNNFQGCPTGSKINSPLISPTMGGSFWLTNMGASSYHPGGALFTLGDASVRFLSDTIDFTLYNYIGGRAEGQAVSVP
jgi:hypothetical protein